jgi:hypothetical protein
MVQDTPVPVRRNQWAQSLTLTDTKRRQGKIRFAQSAFMRDRALEMGHGASMRTSFKRAQKNERQINNYRRHRGLRAHNLSHHEVSFVFTFT